MNLPASDKHSYRILSPLREWPWHRRSGGDQATSRPTRGHVQSDATEVRTVRGRRYRMEIVITPVALCDDIVLDGARPKSLALDIRRAWEGCPRLASSGSSQSRSYRAVTEVRLRRTTLLSRSADGQVAARACLSRRRRAI